MSEISKNQNELSLLGLPLTALKLGKRLLHNVSLELASLTLDPPPVPKPRQSLAGAQLRAIPEYENLPLPVRLCRQFFDEAMENDLARGVGDTELPLHINTPYLYVNSTSGTAHRQVAVYTAHGNNFNILEHFTDRPAERNFGFEVIRNRACEQTNGSSDMYKDYYGIEADGAMYVHRYQPDGASVYVPLDPDECVSFLNELQSGKVLPIEVIKTP